MLLVSLLIWGTEMGFPTTVSTSEIQTTGGGSITLERSVRDVTSGAIDDAVTRITKEGSWLFDGLSTAVDTVLILIENGLKWVPWPAIIISLALLSYAVGGGRLLGFTAAALLFVGFMGLWENMIDTIALVVVAVFIAVFSGFPLGILGSRNQLADNLMRPIPGCDADHAQFSSIYCRAFCSLASGSQPGSSATIIYAVPPVIRLTSLGSARFPAKRLKPFGRSGRHRCKY